MKKFSFHCKSYILFLLADEDTTLNPDSLSVEARKHILGTQANLWSEYMTNEEMVEYHALPRMTALAEVQWTQPERKDFDDFKQRLTGFTQYLDYLHYRYCKHLWPERQMPSRWQF